MPKRKIQRQVEFLCQCSPKNRPNLKLEETFFLLSQNCYIFKLLHWLLRRISFFYQENQTPHLEVDYTNFTLVEIYSY